MSASAAEVESLDSELNEADTAFFEVVQPSEPIEFGTEPELLEFPFPVVEFNPAAATGMIVDGSLPVGSSEGGSPLEDSFEWVGPNGEVVAFQPGEEIPELFLIPIEIDPVASSGLSVNGGQSPTETVDFVQGQDGPLVFVGPDGDLIEIQPGEEIPEFLLPMPIDVAVTDIENEGRPQFTNDAPALTDELPLLIGTDGVPLELFDGQEIPVEFLAFSPGVNAAATGGVAVQSDVVDLQDGIEQLTDPGEFSNDNPNAEGVETIVEDFIAFDNTFPLPSLPMSNADLAASSGGASGSGGVTESEVADFVDDETAGDDSLNITQSPESITNDQTLELSAPGGDSTSVDDLIFATGASSDAAGNAATIQGTEAGEWISGTDGNDVIAAGGGDDEIHVPLGNNIVDGGEGEDRLVIYEGLRDQYTIETRTDGVTILEGPGLNGEAVRVELTNVESIQFNDGSVRVGAAASTGGGSGNGSAIVGTAAGEWVAGTAFDDEIHAGDGDDEIYASLGTNTINGGAGIDTLVVYEGVRTDYILSTSSDGRVYLEGPGLNGSTVRNLLTDLERIQFNDSSIETADIMAVLDAALLSVFE